MDYKIFDSWLLVETWHTGHFYDEQRFLLALKKALKHSDFSPEKLGDYIRSHYPNFDNIERVANEFVSKADIIKEFLKLPD